MSAAGDSLNLVDHTVLLRLKTTYALSLIHI